QLKTISPCFVRIHHAALFDADFGFDKDSEYETQIKLEAGKHPLEITVLGDEAVDVELDWQIVD
ncbi:MAG: hypothetical protein AAF802_32030, partial [Planctomycetota bacterium]